MQRNLAVLGIFALIALAMQNAAVAQTRSLRAMLWQPAAADAVADAYGRAVAAGFAKTISEQGDAVCRKERKLDDAALLRGAQAILVGYGAKLAALQAGRISEDALAAKLDELAGRGSAAALRSVSDERRVKDLQKFFRPRFNDNLVDRIVDALDHYALIHRLYSKSVSPMASGAGLMLAPAERAVAAEEAAKKAFGPDPKLQRLVDLYASLIDASEFAALGSAPPTVADHDVFKGVEVQLQTLCLPPRR